MLSVAQGNRVDIMRAERPVAAYGFYKGGAENTVGTGVQLAVSVVNIIDFTAEILKLRYGIIPEGITNYPELVFRIIPKKLNINILKKINNYIML